MGVLSIHAARASAGAPEIRNLQPTAAAAFNLGSPVQRNSSDDELIEEFAGGATVTGLLGFAQSAVADGLPAAKGDTPYGTTVPVEIAASSVEFMGQLINAAGGAIVAPVAGTHEGNVYGLVKRTTFNDWYVDVADTTDVVVRITKVMPEINAVLFKVIASAIGE